MALHVCFLHLARFQGVSKLREVSVLQHVHKLEIIRCIDSLHVAYPLVS